MTSTDDPLRDERMLDRDGRRDDPRLWVAASSRAMVATAHYEATRAGRAALERGGNAVDATVAAALALGVCEPAGSGLGGMAIATLHHADSGRTLVLEGACRAPRAATPERVAGAHRYRGHAAVAVPMGVAVVAQALERYGTLSAAEVLEPAIALACEGVLLTEFQRRLIERYAKVVRTSWLAPDLLGADGRPAPAGTRLRQPALARTLERLASAGLEDFYRGEIGARIAADSEANGGFLRAADLAAVREVREPEPLRTGTPGWTLCTPGPPAGGLSLVELWHLAAELPGELDPTRPEGAVLFAALVQRSRADRRAASRRLGMLDVGGAGELLDRGYARRVARELSAPRLTGSGETTHVSAMDADGNAVSWTQSIERSFGAGVGAPDLGFFYNGYLRGFKVGNERHPHYLRPGAVARSNAAPTVVLERGVPVAAIGSTGSERMISGIFQTLLGLRRGADPFEAVHAPRLHATPEGLVRYEARLSREQLSALEEAGFRGEPLEEYAFQMGGLNLVVRRGDALVGVAEPRRDGAAAGPRDRGREEPR